MELDIFLPMENLAFEYQGEQHYVNIYGLGTWELMQRDKEKKEKCQQNGITLIEIPYWWDQKISSLAATIQHKISHFNQNFGGEPIPNKPQRGFPSGKI
jgi:hypothetical protein